MAWLFDAAIFLLFLVEFVNGAAVVQEKTVSSCNTPCNRQQLTCPRGYRIAIRETLFSVHQRSLVTPCVPTENCNGQTVCCEQADVRDCVFSYSPSHLEALHRNCSGGQECEVKTERTQEESIACPFFNPDDTVSHTILGYVCIDGKATLDICTPSETTVVGRNLFAMLDSRTWRSPLGGAACRCTAESTQWPTTNTIAVFVVDIRLNVLRQSQCSKADIVLRSGSTTRHLDCATSRDPRLAYPFVALLNHSNVATVELFLHSKLPEYVWIGFESNAAEDIRLTCGLQGYVPLNQEGPAGWNNTASGFLGDGHHAGHLTVASISGILVAVMVVVAVGIVLTVLVLKLRQQKRQSLTEPYSEPVDALDDVYYSMPDVTSPSQVQASMGTNSGKSAKKPTKKSQIDDAKEIKEEDGEVYVTAEQVRERKRKSKKKRVRIVSIPEISNDVEEEYSSPWDIQERRRRDEFPPYSPGLPPKVDSPAHPINSQDEVDAEGEDYATLDRTSRRPDPPTAKNREEEVNYDHLSLRTTGKNENLDMDTDLDKDRKGYDLYDRPEPDGCNHNNGFQEDEVFE